MNAVDALIAQRPGFEQMEPARAGNVSAIRDFIHMSPGTSNSYLVTTAAERIVINTGMGFEAPIHKAHFDALSTAPTRYILLTQGHVDHVGGVRHFREPCTQVVAQANNALCQADDARIAVIRRAQAYVWFSKVADRAIAAAQQDPRILAQDVPVPDLTFCEQLDLQVGDLQMQLHATPGGETIDSMVVWLPQHGILFSGNCFGPLFPHFPNLNTIRGDKYRFVDPYLESLARVRALEPELLITGHFEPVAGRALITACLDRLEAAVRYVHEQTLAGMNAGKDIFTLMREVRLPPELYVGQGYGLVRWAVRTLWESYMGWFKALSTTELYATQPREIYADLVALAGVAAVVERGRARLVGDDPEAGLHLAEVALAGDPTDRDALQLALDAHRCLLSRANASNFWEAGWLRHHIARLEKALNR